MMMPGRKYSAQNDYRYGFNGQEKDNEIVRYGNSYNAEFWQYDSRIGRRWNADPLKDEYTALSPYSAMECNPIIKSDPTGATTEDVIVKGKDKKQWRIKAPGKDQTVNVPVNLKKNMTLDLGLSKVANIEDHLAIGYSIEGSGQVGLGSGGSVSGSLTVMNFTNSTYGGYNYSYLGAGYNGTLGLQEGASLNAGGSIVIAVNIHDKLTNENSSPSTFAGATTSYGISQNAKFIVGGGWNASYFKMTDWKGVTFGLSAGVGQTYNAFTASSGKSTSILLNDEIPTKKRSTADRIFNAVSPIASGVGTSLLRLASTSNNAHLTSPPNGRAATDNTGHVPIQPIYPIRR